MRNLWQFGVLSVVTPLMAGCPNMDTGEMESARLRVVHASPDAPAVDVCSGSARVVEGATFPAATDYLTVPAGTVPVNVIPAGMSCDSAGVIEADLMLAADSDTTVAAVNVLDEIEPLVLTDDNTAPAAGMARVRFVHASPDAPTVDITLPDGTTLFDNISFKEVGDYIEAGAGTLDLDVRDETGMTVVLELNDVTLEDGGVYTVYAIGFFDGDPALDAFITRDN